MSDEKILPQTGAEDGEQENGQQSGTDGVGALPEWAQKKLKEANAEAASYRVKLREREAAEEAAKQKLLEEQGQFKALYEAAQAKVKELETVAEQVKRLGDEQAARNTAALEALPKADKARIEGILAKAGVTDPYKVRDLLDDLMPSKTPPPGMDGGKVGDSKEKTKQADSEQHRQAVRGRYHLRRK